MSDLTPQEEESFAKAASELYEGKREELVWAKAFVEAEGDEDKARTIYIKLRAGQLTERATKKAPAKKAPAKKAPAKRKGAKKKHYDKCPKCRSPKWRNTIQQCSSCGYELKTGTTKRERMRQFVDEQPPTPPRAKPSSHGAGNETESKSDGCCLPVIVIVGLVALFAFTDCFSGDPLNGIYTYKHGSGAVFSIKFREDGSATYMFFLNGSPLTSFNSQWTHKRRGSIVTLKAKNPDKVNLKKMEMTVQENGNLRYVDEKGKVEIFVKEGD